MWWCLIISVTVCFSLKSMKQHALQWKQQVVYYISIVLLVFLVLSVAVLTQLVCFLLFHCAFAQKRTDTGRACWLQLNSLYLFSVVCVCTVRAANVCFYMLTYVASRAWWRARWRVKRGEWNASTKLVSLSSMVHWVNLALRHCRGMDSCDYPEPETSEEGMQHIKSNLKAQTSCFDSYHLTLSSVKCCTWTHLKDRPLTNWNGWTLKSQSVFVVQKHVSQCKWIFLIKPEAFQVCLTLLLVEEDTKK